MIALAFRGKSIHEQFFKLLYIVVFFKKGDLVLQQCGKSARRYKVSRSLCAVKQIGAFVLD